MRRDSLRDDLHPEELLAKASQVALGADEEADLRAHVERCPACALQLALRDDINLALAPTDFDYEIGARAVERLAATPDWGALPATRPTRVARREAPVVARAAVVLAIVLGTGVAASALVLGARGRLWDVRPPAPPANGTPIAHAPRARAGSAPARVVELEAPALEVSALARPGLASPAAAAPPANGDVTPLPPRSRRAAASVAGEQRPPDAVAARVTGGAASVSVERASELFGAAARAQREGDPSEARRLYGLARVRVLGNA